MVKNIIFLGWNNQITSLFSKFSPNINTVTMIAGNLDTATQAIKYSFKIGDNDLSLLNTVIFITTSIRSKHYNIA